MEVRWVQKYGDLGFTWDSEILRCVLTEDIFPLEPHLTCKKPELEITSQIEEERYGRQNPPGYSGGRAPPSGHLRGLCGYQCREAVWYLKPKKKKKKKKSWFPKTECFFSYLYVSTASCCQGYNRGVITSRGIFFLSHPQCRLPLKTQSLWGRG